MDSINTLVDDIICSSTVLLFEVNVVMQCNAFFVIADFIKLGIKSREFSPLFILLKDMVQDRDKISPFSTEINRK
jgi:hypothetical protein